MKSAVVYCSNMELENLIENSAELKRLVAQMPPVVRNRCRMTRLGAGKILFYKGDELSHVHILCSGKIKIMNIFRNGGIFTVDPCKTGYFIGEQAVLAEQERAAVTVAAAEDCVLIRLRREDFLRWVDHDHALCRFLLKKLAARLYPLSQDHGMRSYNDSGYLLKRFLIKLFEKIGSPQTAHIDMTRLQIAEEIGISLRSVERRINELKGEELITVNSRKLYLDRSQYERLIEALEEQDL